MEKLKGTIFESPIMSGLALGDHRYYIGKKCKQCGNSMRLFSNDNCVKCNRVKAEEYRIRESSK